MAVNYLPTGNKPAFDSVSSALKNGTFDPRTPGVSRHYRAAKNGMMWIYNKDKNIKMVYKNNCRYDFDKALGEYTFRLIYNGDGSEYICLEPQTCLANAPNGPFSREEARFAYIKPHEKKIFYSSICLREC
jgi:galactose mutarotase-like enzyme